MAMDTGNLTESKDTPGAETTGGMDDWRMLEFWRRDKVRPTRQNRLQIQRKSL